MFEQGIDQSILGSGLNDTGYDIPIDWTSGTNQSLDSETNYPEDSVGFSLNSLFSNAMQTATAIAGIYSKLKSTPSAQQVLGYKLQSQAQTQSSYLMIGVLVIGAVLLFSFMKK